MLLLFAACGTQPIATGTYTVKRGDTLYSIAWRHDLQVQELARLNRISKEYLIYPGQVLRLSSTAAVRKSAAVRPVPSRVVAAPASHIQWQWPLVTRSYVSTTRPNGGVGLMLNGKLGDDIKAAAAGRVVYSGNGLLGYGQLLIIKHDESYLSAYGHLQAVRVQEGDAVAINQVIATMGNGPAGTPMLYFEIRVNGQPVDPLSLLQGQR